MCQIKLFKSLIFMLPLALALLTSNTAPAIGRQKPSPPRTGTPAGNPRPGTTRPVMNCPKTQTPLTAVVANNGNDFTYSEQPTFWFYIPYRPEQISSLEFLLLDSSERNTIYRASIKLATQPGIIKITIPTAPQYALALNQDYRWRLNLDCAPDTTVEPDLVVDGWIRRIPADAQANNQDKAASSNYTAYIKNEVWHDAITDLAERHFANPTNPELNAAWTQLLRNLGLTDISDSPLVTYIPVREN